MAQMYPENIELYNPTQSEKVVYYALKNQLSDTSKVFYSLSWSEIRDGTRKTSEADFLVFDPRYGYITIEVKGGTGINVDGDRWFLKYNNFEGGRLLDRSPYIQAEESMYYFKDYFFDQYSYPFGGTFGAMVCFPNFTIENPSEISNRPKEVTISYRDMNDLKEKIKKAFIYYRRRNSGNVSFTAEQREQFLKLINKRIQISAACGALIEYQKPIFNVVNRVQDNYVYLLRNYQRFFVSGGAGTGKTWVALKFANAYKRANLKVLLTCMNKNLVEFFKTKINQDRNIDIITFEELLIRNQIIEKDVNYFDIDLIDAVVNGYKKKYDAIIIDEAQDFSVECAMAITQFLVDEKKSIINVFYDKTQNIYDRDFEEGFGIQNPPFCLCENLRNTAKICKWATKNTEFNTDVITNPIEGTDPIQREFTNQENCLNRISMILAEMIDREGVSNESITILIDDQYRSEFTETNIARWNIVEKINSKDDIKLFSVSDYKGLESDVIIYVHKKNNSQSTNYVAYTRARYFLYDLVLK